MYHRFSAALFLVLAFSATQDAAAAEPMDGAAFDAFTRGKTLLYSYNGQPYGANVYLDDRRVRWSFLDGVCKEGFWYEQSDQICFIYDDDPDPHCWSFSTRNGRLMARFQGLPNATELYEAQDMGTHLTCLAPNLGV